MSRSSFSSRIRELRDNLTENNPDNIPGVLSRLHDLEKLLLSSKVRAGVADPGAFGEFGDGAQFYDEFADAPEGHLRKRKKALADATP